MPTIEEQLALTDRLQSIEDNLVAAGKRHVTISGAAGVFEWLRRGVRPGERIEETLLGDPQEAEDMIVAQGWQDILVDCEQGTFTWTPRISIEPPMPRATRSSRRKRIA